MPKITQKMLAKQLGLSRNCVSKALNGGTGISDATRVRVQKTAQAHGYQLQATTMAPCVSLLTKAGSLGNHFWGTFISGLEEALAEGGYRLLIHTINSEGGVLQHLSSNKSRGAVLLWNNSENLLQQLLQEKIPLLCYDMAANASLDEIPCDVLLCFNSEPIYRLTRRLINLKHRKIAFVGDPDSCKSFRERYDGFCQTMAENSMTGYLWAQTQETMYDINFFARAIAERDPAVTAYVCANDYMAIHLMKALKTQGVPVPGEVSVTGFDSLAEADMLSPALTTVDAHVHQLGLCAGRQLLQRIKNPATPAILTRVTSSLIDGASISNPGA